MLLFRVSATPRGQGEELGLALTSRLARSSESCGEFVTPSGSQLPHIFDACLCKAYDLINPSLRDVCLLLGIMTPNYWASSYEGI